MIDTILPILGLILAGYAAGKSPLMPPPAAMGLTTYVLYAAVPALLFRTLSRGRGAEVLDHNVVLAAFPALPPIRP